MKYKKSNLIRIQTKNNPVILTHKTNILIALPTSLKKCEKSKRGLYMEGVLFMPSEADKPSTKQRNKRARVWSVPKFNTAIIIATKRRQYG